MAIPAKYRERLTALCAGCLIVTISPTDPCLLVYPLPAWEEVEQRLSQLPSTSESVRLLKRLLVGNAEECEMDGQGRILLSAALREFASLEKKVALVGQGERFELWDEIRWHEVREQSLQYGRDNPQLLEELAIAY